MRHSNEYPVGMIEMACDCGAQLFYLGNAADGAPPLSMMKRFSQLLTNERVGFFTSADGIYADCPFCSCTYELPDPELMEWLPFMDPVAFQQTLGQLQVKV